MNAFENSFFKKYIAEWQEVKWIIHIHFLDIFSKLFLWLSMWTIIPSVLYFYSERIREVIPFLFLELLLIIVFIKIIYDIFDWYNDVFIVADFSIVSLKWSLFKTDATSIEYDKIEWLEVEQNWIIDKIFKKWNLIIHKFWSDSIVLENSINPYAWINLIEEVSNQASLNGNLQNNKFDFIMDALWWVVENYLDKKMTKNDKEKEISNAIEKIEKSEWTLDLR